MYINFKLLAEKEIYPEYFIFMQAVSQNKSEDLSRFLEDYYEKLYYTNQEPPEEFTLVKAKNKSHTFYQRLRLSDRGKELLEELTTPSVEEQDKKVADYLIQVYTKAKKDVSGKVRIYRHVRDFRIQSGIQKNNLIRVCQDFLTHNEEQSHKLEYIFFKPANAFDTRFRLEDSWVYKHYLKNKERLDATFEQY